MKKTIYNKPEIMIVYELKDVLMESMDETVFDLNENFGSLKDWVD